MQSGGIDAGGTKLDAQLFDDAMRAVAHRRIPAPVGSFDAFTDALVDQARWLIETSGRADLPIGIGLPGVVDSETGMTTAANVPSSGQDMGAALRARLGREAVYGTDSVAFTLSEAQGGAGEGCRNVVGIVIGTGLGAAQVIDGRVPARASGLAVEIGHVGTSARMVAAHGLPPTRCGCGRSGCIETWVAGPGLARLAAHLLGTPVAPPDLAAHPGGERVLAVWSDLAAEALDTLHLLLDPDCFVLGGGLSRLPDVSGRLARALAARRLGQARLPDIRLARFGDASGGRGMALMARAHAGSGPVA
jgi:N-acetylglucosamine kinase